MSIPTHSITNIPIRQTGIIRRTHPPSDRVTCRDKGLPESPSVGRQERVLEPRPEGRRHLGLGASAVQGVPWIVLGSRYSSEVFHKAYDVRAQFPQVCDDSGDEFRRLRPLTRSMLAVC